MVRKIHTLVLSPSATGRSYTDKLILFLQQFAPLGHIIEIVFLYARLVRKIHTLVYSPPATGRSSTDRLILFLKQLAQSVALGHLIEIIFL